MNGNVVKRLYKANQILLDYIKENQRERKKLFNSSNMHFRKIHKNHQFALENINHYCIKANKSFAFLIKIYQMKNQLSSNHNCKMN